MKVNVRYAESDAVLQQLAPVLLELCTHFTSDALIDQSKKQRQQGGLIAVAEVAGEMPGVAGFVVGSKLAWAKHIYVDAAERRDRCQWC